MLNLGHLNARRRLQTPFRQRDIHRRGHIPLIFERHRQRFECRIKRHAFDFLARNRPAAQLQLQKLVARIPIIAGSGDRVAASDLHRHNRQAVVGLKLPAGSPAPAKRPDTTGDHHHDKNCETNGDQPMVRTAFLGRYIPLRLSI